MIRKIISVCFLVLIFVTSKAQLLQIDSLILPYKYLVHIPQQVPATGKYPLMLFLHGSGERGTDINKVRIHNPLSLCKDSLNFPFLFVAPQCPEGQTWNPATLLWMLDAIEKKYSIDKDRIYLVGLSAGGRGVIELAKAAGDRFAAMATVCGCSIDNSTICMIRHIPLWAFHGDQDDTVPLSESENTVTALKALGGDARLTVYPGVKHTSWDNAFADPDLYKWLLQKKRIGKAVVMDEKEKKQYVGTYIYSEGVSSDTLHTNVLLEKGELWYAVPRHAFKVKMYKIKNDLFRLEGVPMQADSELLFIRGVKNKVIGHRYYPCDGTFVPKKE